MLHSGGPILGPAWPKTGMPYVYYKPSRGLVEP